MNVLFICKYNAGRSRMAEAIFNHLSKRNRATSAGISPYPRHASIYKGIAASSAVLNEIGIRCPKGKPKAVTKQDVEKADIVVVLLWKSQLYLLPKYISGSPKTVYYPIKDSDDRSRLFIVQHRRNRDIILRLVERMVKRNG